MSYSTWLSLNHWSQDDTEAWLPLVTRGLNPNLYGIHGCVYCGVDPNFTYHVPCPSVPIRSNGFWTVFFLNMTLQFGHGGNWYPAVGQEGFQNLRAAEIKHGRVPWRIISRKLGSPEWLGTLFLRDVKVTKRMRSWTLDLIYSYMTYLRQDLN